MSDCDLCPRNCHVNRNDTLGFCGAGIQPKLARVALHYWEEPPISGERGSGAVFFSNCNLKCCFCQNYAITHEGLGREITIDELSEKFLYLQYNGAHNINLVTPAHYVPQIAAAIRMARLMGLKIPIVYNTSAYEKVETLKMMEGLVDIYLPDLKCVSPEIGKLYYGAPNYFAFAGSAILEMIRQVGPVILDEQGIMRSGVIVRHLLLPDGVDDSFRCLEWAKEYLPSGVYLSVMAQYIPLYQAMKHPEINRRITEAEYQAVVNKMTELDFEDGFMQGLESASEDYVPNFDLTGV
ncbi:MAG TPA: radical SAM protein [Firmicutes bacterium]|nr:radical SAM protein [Bacillota bacterium]